MFAATLFDYNGVLVDDERAHLAAFRDVLGPLGITISDAEYWERYLGFDDVGAFRAILTDRGRAPSEQEIQHWVEAKRPFYLQRARTGLSPFPGAAPLLEGLASLGPVGVVSGALRREIELGLEVLGVADHVAFIVAAEDTARSKPDPEGYRMGLQQLAGTTTRPLEGNVLVIEDSISGIEAAQSAGLICVAVAHSYPEQALRDAGADLVVGTIADLSVPQLSRWYGTLHG